MKVMKRLDNAVKGNEAFAYSSRALKQFVQEGDL
jgi:hypothetical protein